MSHTPLSRRTMLRGLGGIAIGLPLLDEMLVRPALAAPNAEVPVRAFNVFFGLGIPAPLQAEGFDGPLEPLKPLAKKLAILRDLDHVRCDEGGINAHYDGASAAFTAEPPNGEARSGGPSIDQVIRRSAYPEGLPDGMVPTLVAGTFFRRSRLSRYVHSFNPDGTAAATMQERPRDVFERVFGEVAVAGRGDGARRERLRKSVLDTVVGEYRHYTGPRSPLGAASRTRIAEHLDRIREYEQRAFAERDRTRVPAAPPQSNLKHGDEADPGGEGIDMPLEELVAEWRLLADLYALAIQTDRVRFGSITFLAAGERLRIKGDYEYDGHEIFHFDDGKQRNATGSAGCSHEWWHDFDEKKKNEALRAHAHLKIREVAYFLSRLDDPEHAREANGKSILENSLITVSTESGDGRHANVKRELSGVFHAISGAGGRFKTGEAIDVKAEGIDVYNTMLSAFDTQERLGPAKRDAREIGAIRA